MNLQVTFISTGYIVVMDNKNHFCRMQNTKALLRETLRLLVEICYETVNYELLLPSISSDWHQHWKLRELHDTLLDFRFKKKTHICREKIGYFCR